jgi:hypothetical protein
MEEMLSVSSFKHHLDNGLSIAGALIHGESENMEDITAAFEKYPTPTSLAPRDIDRELADFTREALDDTIIALGVSLQIPGVDEACGGIIGRLDSLDQEAGGLAEPIGHGLSMVSFPGGPGIIIQAPPSNLEGILSRLDMTYPSVDLVQAISGYTELEKIPLCVTVLDGCGQNHPGGVCVRTSEHISWHMLSNNAE